MSNCKCDCSYISIIAGIIFGVILGVLSAFGYVAPVITFWVYLAIGVAGIFFTPIYGLLDSLRGSEYCFCSYRNILLIASAGTIIAAGAGLIIALIDSLIAIAVAIALATLFAVTLLHSVICLAKCIGCRN